MNYRLKAINDKIVNTKDLQRKLLIWRMLGDHIVFTNGCFDILHRGHLEYLTEAASLGNRLVVGLNSNTSVEKLKGKGRPVNDEKDRAFQLASLGVVDAVVIFEEDTPINLIQLVEPEVLVKGGDYKKDEIVGAKETEARGGKVAIISFTEGYSTTKFLNQLRNLT